MLGRPKHNTTYTYTIAARSTRKTLVEDELGGSVSVWQWGSSSGEEPATWWFVQCTVTMDRVTAIQSLLSTEIAKGNVVLHAGDLSSCVSALGLQLIEA